MVVVSRVLYQDYSSEKLEEHKPKVTRRRFKHHCCSSMSSQINSHSAGCKCQGCTHTTYLPCNSFTFLSLLIHLERSARAERHRMKT